MNKNTIENTGLFSAIRHLIETSKHNVAVSVNAEMTLLYWNIGKRINEEIGEQSRAESYGKQIVATLWRQLTNEYGASFSEKNLRRMMQFAEVFPDEKIVVSLIRQLSWTHIIALIPIENPFPVRSVVSTDRQHIPLIHLHGGTSGIDDVIV